MQILPAIDIKDGQAVRLFKGDFNQQTVVNPDVIEQAKTLRMRAFNYSCRRLGRCPRWSCH
ncbi:MAG: HisA/HisF-related TIM barrel protein [Streptococcus salivarius]